MAATIEKFTAAPVESLTLVDNFVRLRGTSGGFPPPLGTIDFQLVARIPAAGPIPLDPPIIPTSRTNGAGIFLFPNECTVGSSPVLRLPSDRYRLRIHSEVYQPLEFDVTWPADLAAMASIFLNPGYAYPFPDLTLQSSNLTLVRGNLYQPNGARKPIGGAVVSITDPPNTWPFATCVTDKNGGWALAIPLGRTAPPFQATLHFALPDATAFDVSGVTTQPGAENSLPQTALRGAVLTTTDAPIPNAEVTVNGIAGVSRTGSDGSWSFYMSLIQPDVQGRVTATGPGGQNQSQDVQIRKGMTVPVPPFRISIN